MKKRSKRLLAMQQNLPWQRVRELSDSIHLPGRIVTRWTEGAARELKTTVLSGLKRQEFSNVLRKSIWMDQEKHQYMTDVLFNEEQTSLDRKKASIRRGLLWTSKRFAKSSKGNRREFSYKEKNSCFFLGKGRTFNREFLVSRHTFRHLASFGLISGLRGF